MTEPVSVERKVKELARTLQEIIRQHADEDWCSWPGNDIQFCLADFLGDHDEMVRLMSIMEEAARDFGLIVPGDPEARQDTEENPFPE
jgi:hypothetical protein